MSYEKSGIAWDSLQPNLRAFVEKWAARCQPEKVHVCDGSEEENQVMVQELLAKGRLQPLPKLENRCRNGVEITLYIYTLK